MKDENLIVGLEPSDDAAVYRLNEEQALIQTLDFFTPVVDDPFTFGQVAAANSLSDVYAMGGKPLLAMNIVCFPNCLDPSVLKEILLGGADKVKEAGALLVGGHSVEDDEPKYGLSVSGLVHPDKVLANVGAKPGDMLILTKPLGLGIINTAIKASLTDDDQYKGAVHTMATLNKYSIEALEGIEIHACTDITGFGLIGHSIEMAEGSKVSIEIDSAAIPILEGAVDFAQMGIIPGGMYTNKKYMVHKVENRGADEAMEDIMYDPQTSGGLLLALPEKEADKAIQILREKNPTKFAVIGRVMEADEKTVYLK